jgi:hypothetical protein
MSDDVDSVQPVTPMEVHGGQGTQIGDHNQQVNHFNVAHFHAAARPVVRSAYLEQVSRIAPLQLHDRADELAELAAFCTEAERGPYAWWRASAWSGKSALMSWLVLNPPPGARIVSFFVTARWRGNDDRDAFTHALLEQLADLLEEPLPAYLTDTTREPYLLRTLARATEACRQRGQGLVLVVDGLDEDRGVTIGPEAHSIAELLPSRPPAGLRVIVAGRPDPPVPSDVPDDHPLRDPAIVRILRASRQAAVVRADMQRELKRLLQGGPAERDLLGLVAAAGGGLSAGDLAELTGLAAYDIEENLRAVAGRTFTARASQWQPRAGSQVYVLGHEELQASAVRALGEARLTEYRARLRSWAGEYQRQGWPVRTPEYLFRGYFRLLLEARDVPRIVACAADDIRHDRMLDVTGGDTAALTEILEAQSLLIHGEQPDLPSLARLNVHRTRIAERNAYVPVTLPAVWAAIGHPERGEALARAINDPSQRARALAEMARATDNRDQARMLADLAVTAAQAIGEPVLRARALAELVQVMDDPAWAWAWAWTGALSDQAPVTASRITVTHSQTPVLIELVRVATRGGDLARAIDAARAVADPDVEARLLSELARTASEAGDLAHAEGAAAAITHPDARALALGDLARAVARAGDRAAAWPLQGRALAAARLISVPERRTSALEELAQLAVQTGNLAGGVAAAQSIVGEDQARVLVDLARAAAEAGGMANAGWLIDQALAGAQAVSDSALRAVLLASLARTMAATGATEQAVILADQVLTDAKAVTNPFRRTQVLTDAAWELAAARLLTQAAAAARAVADPVAGAELLAGLARTAARTTGRTQAALLVAEALAVAAAVTDSDQRASVQAALAQASAKAGDLPQAATIALAIPDPASQAQVLAELARTAAASGDQPQAKLITGRAVSASYAIADPSLQGQAQARLARAALAAGDLDQAVMIAGAVANPGLRARVLAELAHAADVVGQPARVRALTAQALNATGAVTRPRRRKWLLAELVRTAARSGNSALTLAFARAIVNPAERTEALQEAESIALAAGNWGLVQSVAEIQAGSPHWAHVMARLAHAAAATGDLARAKEAAAQGLAAALAMTGDAFLADAGQLIQQQYLFSDLALAAARADAPGLALDAVKAITSLKIRAQALAEIIEVAAEAGDPGQGQELAHATLSAVRDIPAAELGVQALGNLAKRAVDFGGIDLAKTLIRQAMTAVRAKNSQYSTESLVEMAGAAARAGDFELAETVALAVVNPAWQPQLLADLARAAAQAGEPERATRLAHQALTSAQPIADPYRYLHRLSELARAVREAGSPRKAELLVDRAYMTASSVVDARMRASLLAVLARRAAGDDKPKRAAELTAEAISATEDIDQGYDKTKALIDLAWEARDAGDQGQAAIIAAGAHAAADEIENRSYRALARVKLEKLDERFARDPVPEADEPPAGTKADVAAVRAIADPDRRARGMAEAARTASPGQARLLLAESLTTGHWLESVHPLAKVSSAAVIAIADEYLNLSAATVNFQWASPSSGLSLRQ